MLPLRADTGSWRTHGSVSRRNGVLPSNRRIAGSCSPISSLIISKHWSAVSPSCSVGVCPPSPSPPLRPPVELRRNRRWTVQGTCHRLCRPFCRANWRVTSYKTLAEPYCFSTTPVCPVVSCTHASLFCASFGLEWGLIQGHGRLVLPLEEESHA